MRVLVVRVLIASVFVLSILRGCGTYITPPQALASLVSAKADPENESIAILTYHRFGAVAVGPTTITTSTFEYQLDYFASHGYTVIPLRLLVDWLRGVGPAPPPRSVVITADDGHKSVYTEMLPVVRRHHVPVTLFIYPSVISNASYAMTWDELKELQSTGLFDIESHTYWHPNFNEEKKRLRPTQYEELVVTQLAKSKKVLENKLQTKADLLAWPYGIYDDDLITKAAQAGYIAALALNGRRVTSRDAIFTLPRYLITESDTGARLESILGKGADRPDPEYHGEVIDGVTAKPIDGATVTLDGTVAITDAKGIFQISGDGSLIGVRAPGYLRRDIDGSINPQPLKIALVPFRPKALYLSFYGIGSTALRNSALKLIDETELNALVIDVKGDRGMISFKSTIPLVQTIGAEKETTIRDIKALMASLKEKGVYTIARIVVFKDEPLATARKDLAVKSMSGETWLDREHLAWTDPFSQEVWNYNIDIAVEAAQFGFDEIQFDYVRFPDAPGGLLFSMADTEQNRLNAISGFLKEARQKLIPYNVFLSTDIFGYVCWNLNDTGIGQRLEELAPNVDYISPMLYPSGFQSGIPGYANPVTHPHEIVFQSLEKAGERLHISAARFRPWLQAFRDYAFDKRPFGEAEVRAQIDAAESFGSDGWMLWDPHNTYFAADLSREQTQTNFESENRYGPHITEAIQSFSQGALWCSLDMCIDGDSWVVRIVPQL